MELTRSQSQLLLRSTLGERILRYSCRFFRDAVRFQGMHGRHLGLADHSPRFRARALNPAEVKSRGLTRFGLDAMRFSGFARHFTRDQ